MSTLDIRKLLALVETTKSEMGSAGRSADPQGSGARGDQQTRLPGVTVRTFRTLTDIGENSATCSGRWRWTALGIAPSAVESFGKAAIVGEEGELEHAAAILHPKLGKPFRAAVEKGAVPHPLGEKNGGPGTAIDVPLGHKDAAFVRSHFDAMEVRVPDAPRRGEIVVALVVTDSGRPRPRVGGLTKDQIEGKDGLR